MAYLQRGYLCEHVIVNGKTTHRPVHRRVWEEANGPIPEGHVIHHRNGDRLDNRLENLECILRAAHPSRHRTRSDETHRMCGACEQRLPHAEFWKGQKRCKTCSRASRDAWAAEHPERLAEYNRRRRRTRAVTTP